MSRLQDMWLMDLRETVEEARKGPREKNEPKGSNGSTNARRVKKKMTSHRGF